MNNPKIALIDGDFMCYRVAFACEDDPDSRLAKNRLTEWLTDCVYIDLQCDDYIAYLTGSSNYRYEIAKTVGYKSNRKDMKKPKYLNDLREHFQRLGAKVTEGIEADDAVAIKMTQEPDKYILLGVDKDLLQIPGNHYNPVTCEHRYITQVEADYNFWKQMLTGDRTDAIPGLYGIGPKKAEKILKDCVDYASMEAAVWKAYQDKGHGIDYFTEQGRLLHLQRYEGQLWSPKLNGETLTVDGSTQTKPLKDVSDDNSVQSRQESRMAGGAA
jgi:hypothetical protein